MSPPTRQVVILSRVEESISIKGQSFPLATCEYPGGIHPAGYRSLRAFDPEPFPRWAFQAEGWTVEKQLRLLPDENTVLVSYTLLGGERSIGLHLNPLFALRGVHELSYQWNANFEVERCPGSSVHCHHRILATSRTPEVFFAHDGRLENSPHWYLNSIYRCEQRRGYAALEDLWMPGTLNWTLSPGQTAHFAVSTDPMDLARVVSASSHVRDQATPPRTPTRQADRGLTILFRAAGQFIAQGRTPSDDASPTDRQTTILAGFPWMTRAGRDSLIALPGLLLVTGRLEEAKSVLALFASLERDGLMPSEIPADGSDPRFLGADISLWFINAAWQYLRYGGDVEFVIGPMLTTIESILNHYREGAALGIRVTPEGLLSSRETGLPVTWMDAKIGDWVITARHGCAVEVNALWHNAQRIAASLFRAAGRIERADQITVDADATRAAFNARFWNDELHCCYDVIEGSEGGAHDPAIRPNQLFAVSLAFPVLSLDRHHSVLDIVRRELLTPVGPRTLASSDPNYGGRYFGPVLVRDRAYHQGSVYPWLLGAYLTGLVKVRGRGQLAREEARSLLQGCCDHLIGPGMGQLCELFDGDFPHHPGGLPASARSTAEILRAYYEDVLDLGPARFNLIYQEPKGSNPEGDPGTVRESRPRHSAEPS